MIAQFALRLVCGMSLTWCFMRRDQVTSGFFRIQMLIALGLSVLAALSFGSFAGTAPEEGTDSAAAALRAIGPFVCGGLAAAAFAGSVLWTLERRRGGTIVALSIAVASAGWLVGQAALEARSGTHAAAIWLDPASELASSALLGGALSGMLLGHWYLTAPTMSIAPLAHLNRLFGAAAAGRLALSAIALVLAGPQLAGGTHATWLTLRRTAGIAGPLITAWMVSRILRYRNTQAATGVLFVAVILTFIGELSAALLSRELGLAM